MTLEELRAELAAGKLRPAYLIAGEEPLQRDDALAALRAHVLAGAPVDFNLDRLDGTATSKAELIDALRSLPVMAPRRLVELREPEAPRALGRGLAEALAAVVEELAQGSASVLVVDRREGRSPHALGEGRGRGRDGRLRCAARAPRGGGVHPRRSEAPGGRPREGRAGAARGTHRGAAAVAAPGDREALAAGRSRAAR